jgi:PKD repeat protein
LVLATDTYTVTAQASGYFSQTVSNVSVISGQIATQDFGLDPLPPPTAAFTTNSPICLGEPLVVTNTSTNAATWSWDWDDGQGSTAWEPTHVYSASATVQVNPLPSAAFHWAANGLEVTFYNDSQAADAYLWQFGDGLTATLPTPTHTYTLSATYPVTLTAYDGCGQDLATRTVWAGVEGPWRIYLPVVLKGSG